MFSDDYYEPSTHILDNLTPEEDFALSLFQQVVAAGKINPADAVFNETSFLRCLEVSEKITAMLKARHDLADSLAMEAISDLDPKSKFKVVSIKESVNESNC